MLAYSFKPFSIPHKYFLTSFAHSTLVQPLRQISSLIHLTPRLPRFAGQSCYPIFFGYLTCTLAVPLGKYGPYLGHPLLGYASIFFTVLRL